jgi:hypothetical protein
MAESDSDLLLLPQPRRVTRLGSGLASDVTLPQRLTVEGFDAKLATLVSGHVFFPPAASPSGWGTVAAPGHALCVRVSADSPADAPRLAQGLQRYALRIAPADTPGSWPVRITAASITAARYALATLGQLLTRFGRKLPALLIEDEPALATRGVMLDVSRNRVPTMRHLTEVVHTLARLKVNHLQLYTEHAFAYEGHEPVWRGTSPLTPSEIRRVDDLCAAVGIELSANQNCFGHLHRWLKLPQYAHLAETHGDWMFDAWPRSGPFSLCPIDEASAEFVDGLLAQLLPCFRSDLVNIGCDETYDIAFGRSKLEVAKRGREAVYLDFVRKIAALCAARGKRPMFWSDIALHRPQSLPDVPKELLALCWGYEPDAPFATWLEQTHAAGLDAWVCPGTSSWRTFFGRPAERAANIAAAVEAATAHGASGLLACDWGDEGHRQVWPISAIGLAHAAGAAWNPHNALRPSLRAISLHALDDDTLSAAEFCETAGEADSPVRRIGAGYAHSGKSGPLRNASATFADLAHALHSAVEVGPPSTWRTVADALALMRVPPGLGPLLADELQHALDVSRLAAARAVARRYKGGLAPAARALLADQAAHVIADHKRLWSVHSRSGGLGESVAHYQRVLDELRRPA